MFLLHPFDLVPALLVPIAASALLTRGQWRRHGSVAALVALLAGEALLLLGPRAAFNDFKAIYAPMNTPDAKVLAELRTSRGLYQLLDNFTERVDTDISNNAGMMGLPGPPQTFGLYRDGNRLAALPKPTPGGAPLDVAYAPAGLDALPYALLPKARALVIGSSGGFRPAAVQSLGAASVDVVETAPVLRHALRHGLATSPPGLPGTHTVFADGPLAALDGKHAAYDIIDISADFMDAAEANLTAFTTEAVATYLRALKPGGILSIPVSIRDFPVYALRMLASARAGLRQADLSPAADHVLVYRSAWSVRILVSPAKWSADRIAAAKAFADERSFDLSYYPGIDPVAARAHLYNDLPAVSFTSGEVSADGPRDAIADEAGIVLKEGYGPSSQAFRLDPTTTDRPSFYSVLRLSQLDTILKRLEILPQPEISGLVNLAVLAQAIVIALLVLAVPLVAPGRLRGKREPGNLRPAILRAAVYFPCLGLGFLFLEIFVIERASFYLNDRASAFALVLTGMLIFSGLGSMAESRFAGREGRGIALAGLVTLIWCVLVWLGLESALMATIHLPWALRAALVILLVVPVSLALGLPFPLGLSQAGTGGMLPWAWALNGAFSVIATPLANLIARDAGYSWVLIFGAILYVIALITFPFARKPTP
jgi:protein-L-isoaspartate O-methyltransferase